MKVALGTEVGLSPGNIVLDRDPAPEKNEHCSPTTFRPVPLWPNGWMDQDATWYGDRAVPLSVGELGLHLAQCGLG